MRAYGYFYVLALLAQHTDRHHRSAWREAHLATHEDSSAALAMNSRPPRAHRLASAAPTSLRTAAQLERLADRLRASSAKLARIWMAQLG